MTDNSQPTVQTAAKAVYSALVVSVYGTREGVTVNAYANVLTGDVDNPKIDRDLLFRVGRKLEMRDISVTARLYEAANPNKPTFEFSAYQRNGKWQVSATNGPNMDDYEEEMSETRRPGKGGKSGEIDPGPAILKLCTAVFKKYNVPIVQLAAEAGPRVSKTATQIATFNEAIQKAEALKTGDPATDGVVDALIATLRSQVADLTARQEKGQKLAASRKSAAQPAASTVAVAATPVGRVTDQKNPTKKGK